MHQNYQHQGIDVSFSILKSIDSFNPFAYCLVVDQGNMPPVEDAMNQRRSWGAESEPRDNRGRKPIFIGAANEMYAPSNKGAFGRGGACRSGTFD